MGPSSSKKENKNQGCAYKDRLQAPDTLVNINQPDRENWVNKYFQVSKNQNCLGDAKITLQRLLKTYYGQTKDTDVTKTKNVRELLSVWNSSAELAAMPRTEADKYNIDNKGNSTINLKARVLDFDDTVVKTKSNVLYNL